MSLEDVALAVGLPGKIGGRGSEIEAMVRRGEIDKVRACCEGDCLNVFVLYVWWALLSGRIDPAGCNASLQSLIDFLESERDVRLHLGAFLDRWRATSRPMPSFVPRSDSRFSHDLRRSGRHHPAAAIVGLTSDERVIAGGFSFA